MWIGIPRWLPNMNSFLTSNYGNINKKTNFVLESTNRNRIEHKLYMNVYWMVPYKSCHFLLIGHPRCHPLQDKFIIRLYEETISYLKPLNYLKTNIAGMFLGILLLIWNQIWLLPHNRILTQSNKYFVSETINLVEPQSVHD